MNNIKYVPFLYLFFNFPFLRCSVGCMDNSKHLLERYDNKEYGMVECDCKCTKMLPDGKTCFACGHVRIPAKVEVLKDAAQTVEKRKAVTRAVLDYFANPHMVMQQLIDEHKKRQ